MANRIQVSAKVVAALVVVVEDMATDIEVAWVVVTIIAKVLRTSIEATLRTSLAMEKVTITTEVAAVEETSIARAVEAIASSMSASVDTAADTIEMAAAAITEAVMTSVSPMEAVTTISVNSSNSSSSSQTIWLEVLMAITLHVQAQVHHTNLAKTHPTITLLSVPTTL